MKHKTLIFHILLWSLWAGGCATLNYQNIPKPERKRYFELAAVASQEKADQYAALPDTVQREAFWQKFWKEKDPTPTTRRNERYEEHQRRVAYADTFFFQPAYFWDDRGKIYIKYGEPDFRESNPMGDALYSSDPFASTDDISGNADGEQRAVRIMSGTYGWEKWTYERLGTAFSFMQKDVGYFLVKDLGAAKSGSHRATVKSLQAADLPMPFLEDSLGSDIYEHDYGQPLNFPFDLARFFSSGRAEIWISYAVPLGSIAFDETSGRGLLSRSIVIMDDDLNEVGRDEKTLTPLRPAGPKSSNDIQAIDLAKFILLPGSYTLAISLLDLNSGKTGIYKYRFSVIDYAKGAEETSDLVLCNDIRRDSSEGTFNRGGYKIIPQPNRAFRKGRDIFFYYEIYDLKGGGTKPHTLQTRHLIFPKKGNKAMASQQESIPVASPVTSLASGLATSDLPAGEYILVLEIKDQDNGKTRNIAKPFRIF